MILCVHGSSPFNLGLRRGLVIQGPRLPPRTLSIGQNKGSNQRWLEPLCSPAYPSLTLSISSYLICVCRHLTRPDRIEEPGVVEHVGRPTDLGAHVSSAKAETSARNSRPIPRSSAARCNRAECLSIGRHSSSASSSCSPRSVVMECVMWRHALRCASRWRTLPPRRRMSRVVATRFSTRLKPFLTSSSSNCWRLPRRNASANASRHSRT